MKKKIGPRFLTTCDMTVDRFNQGCSRLQVGILFFAFFLKWQRPQPIERMLTKK